MSALAIAAGAWLLAAGMTLGTWAYGRRRRQRLHQRVYGTAWRPSDRGPSSLVERWREHPEWRWPAVGLLGMAAGGAAASWIGALGGAVLGPVLLFGAQRQWARLRHRRLAAAIPDFLASMASGLRAGGSPRQVVRTVARDTGGPLGAVLTEILRREEVGFTLDEVFEDVGRTEQVASFRLLATALAVQRRTGGSLAQLLDTMVAALKDREQLSTEVETMTSQGRMTMSVLTALPVLLGLGMAVIDPHYLTPLVGTSIGHLMLAYAVLSMGIGLWWIMRMVRSI